MAKVLTAVAAVFFLGGLALTVGYVANQVVLWQMHREVNLEHVNVFYFGGVTASIGMITLALLEIRHAILMTVEHEEIEPQAASSRPNAPPPKSRAKRSWKKSADIQRSFLDTRGPD